MALNLGGLGAGLGAAAGGYLAGARAGEAESFRREQIEEDRRLKRELYAAQLAKLRTKEPGETPQQKVARDLAQGFGSRFGDPALLQYFKDHPDAAAAFRASMGHLSRVIRGEEDLDESRVIPFARIFDDVERGNQPPPPGGPGLGGAGAGGIGAPPVVTGPAAPTPFQQARQERAGAAPTLLAPSNLGEVRKQAFGAPPLPFQFQAAGMPEPGLLGGVPPATPEERARIETLYRGEAVAPPKRAAAPRPTPAKPTPAPAPDARQVLEDRLMALIQQGPPGDKLVKGDLETDENYRKRVEAENKPYFAEIQRGATVLGVIPRAQKTAIEVEALPGLLKALEESRRAGAFATTQRGLTDIATRPGRVANYASMIEDRADKRRRGWATLSETQRANRAREDVQKFNAWTARARQQDMRSYYEAMTAKARAMLPYITDANKRAALSGAIRLFTASRSILDDPLLDKTELESMAETVDTIAAEFTGKGFGLSEAAKKGMPTQKRAPAELKGYEKEVTRTRTPAAPARPRAVGGPTLGRSTMEPKVKAAPKAKATAAAAGKPSRNELLKSARKAKMTAPETREFLKEHGY